MKYDLLPLNLTISVNKLCHLITSTPSPHWLHPTGMTFQLASSNPAPAKPLNAHQKELSLKPTKSVVAATTPCVLTESIIVNL